MNSIYIKIILIPVISGLIGWLTNKVAVWMLFNPKEPINFLGIKIQGVFPKRQNTIALRISEMVMENLLSPETIKGRVFNEQNIDAIEKFANEKIDFYLENDFSDKYPFLSLFVGNKRKARIKEEILSKLDSVIVDLRDNFETYLNEKIDLKKVIYDKISGLDSGEVNDLMNKILKNELFFIEIVGGVLGFIIGLIQILIFYLF